MQSKIHADRKMWFSMWFLGAIVTFGIAFFPMFYRLIEARNKHLQHEAELEKKMSIYLESRGRTIPLSQEHPRLRNSTMWTVSLLLIIPVFVILYLLSKDLLVHERDQDAFLAISLPQRIFMPQTIPIKTYVFITIVTLGAGVVYWLYKVVNLYNAHYKAELQVEEEIKKLTEAENVVGSM